MRRFSASWCCSRRTLLLLFLLVLASLVNDGAAVTVQRTSRTCNNATFRCDEEGGTSSIPIEWILNGTKEHRCLVDSIKDQANQVIKMNVSPDCEGFLQCSLQSGLWSAPIPVFAYPELTALTISFSQSATVGSNVTLHCDIIPSALLAFNIKWYHNNTEIADENEYVLQLVNLGISDNGNYSCSARANSNNNLPFDCNLKVDGRTMQINVFEPLQLTQELEFIRNVDGTYNFTVLATGVNVTYRWFVNNVLVNTSTMPSLRQDFKPGSVSQVTVEILDELSPLISQTICVYLPPDNLQFIGMTVGLSFLGIIVLLLIIAVIVTAILSYVRRPKSQPSPECQSKALTPHHIELEASSRQHSHDEALQPYDKIEGSSQEQPHEPPHQPPKPNQPQQPHISAMDTTAKDIYEAFVNAANTKRNHDELPRFFIECIKHVLEKALPILRSKHRNQAEYEKFYDCVNKMKKLAENMIQLFDETDREKELERLRAVQTDDVGDDDGDVLNEKAELLKQVDLLKSLLKQDEFHYVTTTAS